MTPTYNPIVHVVLVRPLYSRNVGSVSRVMGNMGAQRLILIDAQCEIDYEARQGAAGAQTHLMEITQYKSWEHFFENEQHGVRIAFCAREKIESDTLTYEERILEIKNNSDLSGLPIYLIFGPEDHGLSNDDVRLANFICALPTYGSFISLNLSHAVLLALYILKAEYNNTPIQKNDLSVEEPAAEKFFFPEEVLQTWLQSLGFQFGDRRTDAYKVLKRILLKNISSPKELRILEAILFQTVRKLQK